MKIIIIILQTVDFTKNSNLNIIRSDPRKDYKNPGRFLTKGAVRTNATKPQLIGNKVTDTTASCLQQLGQEIA